MKQWALVLLSLALTACETPTELMLVVKAAPGLSYGPGNDIDTLHVQVQPADEPPMEFFFTRLVELCPPEAHGTLNCRPQQFADDSYTGALTLPVRLLFIPGDQGMDKEIRIWVDALKIGYLDPRLANGMRFRFSHGHRLWLELPLYHQCLDNLKCEATDQVCNKNQDCETLQPTDSEPPLDPTELPDAGINLSVPELVDMSQLPDLAQICGELNQACCEPSGSCNSGLMCNASKFCTDSSCGQLGNPCCTSGMQCLTNGATCNAAMVCVPPCGALDQACCASGVSCLQGQCFPNYADMGQPLCEACGTAGQRCCPGDVCAAGNNCTASMCQLCGTLGMPACRSGTACQGVLVPDSAGLCNPCGSTPGSGCCPGPTCNSLGMLTCDTNDAPYTNPTSNVCIVCGGLGGWCCADPLETKPCQTGLVCNGMKRCITATGGDMGAPPCGGSGQACCNGSVCNASLACQGATCVPCGFSGQPCCPIGGDMGCSCMALQSLQFHIQSGGATCP